MKDRNRTKYTVLGILAMAPASGYEINKIIKNSTRHFWMESEGQLYPALALCVKEKLATCREEKASKTQRIRKIYTITTKGKKLLKEWLESPAQSVQIRNELLLKLFFGSNLDIASTRQHLKSFALTTEKELPLFEKIRSQLISEEENSPHLPFWLITLDYGIKISQAQLVWCKESLKILNALQEK